MKKDRVDILMDVEFKYGEDKQEVTVYIPFPIFIQAVKRFSNLNNMVELDGTDNAIWNLLVDFGCIDNLENNEEIISYCKELYQGTSFEEEDYEEWKDDYEYDHNLGQYAEEN